MHYKTIKFNIEIPLNIHNLIFCGALRAKFRYCEFARKARRFFFFFFFFWGGHFINPPPSKKLIDAAVQPPPPPPQFKKASYALAARCLHSDAGANTDVAGDNTDHPGAMIRDGLCYDP